MSTIDLSPFDDALRRQEEGAEIAILSMDGKTLTGLVIRVAGPDSERARRAREALHQELVDAQRTTPLTPAEVSSRGARFLAKLTVGWSPNVKVDGDELSASEENAFKVYERYRFIRVQVDNGADRSAFMPASPRSSATRPENS